MRRLVLPPPVRRELTDIVRYLGLQSGSVAVARAFGARLRAQCVRLAGLPGTMGVARPAYGPEVRATFHEGYVLLFRYEPGMLRIVGIIEGHRDLSGWSESGEG